MTKKLHPLVEAGIKNEYWVHSSKYANDILNTKKTEKLKNGYVIDVSIMFRELIVMTGDVADWSNKKWCPEQEIILEIILSWEHLANALTSIEALLTSLPIFRLFMDNIARYYSYDKHRIEKIDFTSFDKKKFSQFNRSADMKKIFSKKCMVEYHFSGAESHLCSLINKNITLEYLKDRNQYILNIYKTMFVEFIGIWADIVVKIAKHNNDKKSLALYLKMAFLNVYIGRQAIRIEQEINNG